MTEKERPLTLEERVVRRAFIEVERQITQAGEIDEFDSRITAAIDVAVQYIKNAREGERQKRIQWCKTEIERWRKSAHLNWSHTFALALQKRLMLPHE